MSEFNRNKFNPVRTLTAKGRFLVGAVRFLMRIRAVLGGKDYEHTLDGHHEDPRKMKARHLIYFSHKYYFKAITKSNYNSALDKYFHSRKGMRSILKGFVPDKEITLTAGGDLMPYVHINKSTTRNIWDEAGDFFFQADIVTANLETPLVPSRKTELVPEVGLNHMYFNGNTEMFDIFSGNGKYKGYDVLSIANNHSLDQGEEGLIATMNFLEKLNIPYSGAAKIPESQHDFPIIEKEGIRIAFLSFTFSLNAEILSEGKEWMCNHLNLNEADADISRIVEQSKIAREKGADIIVAALHMGCAYQPYPSLEIVENMHRICHQTGIDIVLGGHPHNTQPMEWLDVRDPWTGEEKQTFIIYSQADFIAWDIFKWCHLPLLLKFTIASGVHNGKKVVRVNKVEGRLYYMQAKVEKGRITDLRLRDFKNLRTNKQAWPTDPASVAELTELFQFADTFLLPGNLEEIVDTGK